MICFVHVRLVGRSACDNAEDDIQRHLAAVQIQDIFRRHRAVKEASHASRLPRPFVQQVFCGHRNSRTMVWTLIHFVVLSSRFYVLFGLDDIICSSARTSINCIDYWHCMLVSSVNFVCMDAFDNLYQTNMMIIMMLYGRSCILDLTNVLILEYNSTWLIQ